MIALIVIGMTFITIVFSVAFYRLGQIQERFGWFRLIRWKISQENLEHYKQAAETILCNMTTDRHSVDMLEDLVRQKRKEAGEL